MPRPVYERCTQCGCGLIRGETFNLNRAQVCKSCFWSATQPLRATHLPPRKISWIVAAFTSAFLLVAIAYLLVSQLYRGSR